MEFFVGVNLPWLSYGNDFGASAWHPDGGAGRPEQRARLDAIFARLAGHGLRHVRWFLLCDGRAGLVVDDAGVPLSLDSLFWRDLESAVEAASRHGLALSLVLFDFPWCARGRVVDRVQLGGRRRLLACGATRRLLLERIVAPILERCATEPAIAAWDLFNEPEWATFGYGAVNPLASVRPRVMRAILGDLFELVHALARQPATVGLAVPRGMRLVRGLPLDILQLHWYDRRSRSLPPLDRQRSKDAPVLLGEFPTRGSKLSGAEIVERARELGYCGALGWSALAADRHSSLDALEHAVESRRRAGPLRHCSSAE